MRLLKPFIIVFLAFVVTGCVANVQKQAVHTSVASELLKFSAPSDAGRVYFLNGVTTNQILVLRHAFPAALMLNEVLVGEVNKEDVLVADITPGSYEAYWRLAPIATASNTDVKTRQTVTINAGEIYVIRADFNPGGTGFGLLGAALSPPSHDISISKDTSGISGLNLIKPIACPATLCR